VHDDTGWVDFGIRGREISVQVLEALVEQGVRFGDDVSEVEDFLHEDGLWALRMVDWLWSTTSVMARAGSRIVGMLPGTARHSHARWYDRERQQENAEAEAGEVKEVEKK
jgi:hypothetical protein